MYLDHIVCIVPDLKEVCRRVRGQLNREPFFGGKHENFGTHNAILALHNEHLHNHPYLEFLAIDPEDIPPRDTYPFGLNQTITRPKIVAWAVRCDNIKKTAKAMRKLGKPYEPGKITTMARHKPDGSKISWKTAINFNQIAANNGIIPFLVDWYQGIHPTDDLNTEHHCNLANFSIKHPQGEQINADLHQLGLKDTQIEYGPEPAMNLTLENRGNFLILTS